MIPRTSLLLALLVSVGVGPLTQSAAPHPTPGALALMGGQADATDSLRRGLTDSDPLARTVAARLAAVRADTSVAGDLATALEKETDGPAEAEMVRALLFLGGEPTLDGLRSRLQRAAPGTIVVVANWIAQALPEQFAARLPQLAERLGPQVGRLRASVLLASRRPALEGAPLRAWLGVTSVAGWSSVTRDWSVALTSPSETAVVLEALGSSNANMREATVWMLVFRLSGGRTVSTALLDASMAPESVPPPSDQDLTWEGMGRELIARQRGRTTPDRSEFLTREAATHSGDLRGIARLEGIRATEERALRAALGDQFRNRDALKRAPMDDRPTGGAMRTLPMPWPGFLASLLTAAECELSKTRRFGAIRATYREDGRRDRVQIDVTTMSPGCAKAIEALARLIVADPDQRPVGATGEWVLVPMDTAFLACTGTPGGADVESVRLADGRRARLASPTKVHDQPPTYPPNAVRDHIQGVVLIEGVIASNGCPASLRLVHGVDPGLDSEALRAVSAWRYKPAETDGAPPVTMSLTVSFALR